MRRYSMLAVPPPYPGESIRPEVVVFLSARILGIGSSDKVMPGTRVGSENDSDRIMIMVLSVRLLLRDWLVFSAILLYR